MARHEANREDLMSEAAALVRRAEFAIPSEPAEVVAGFRATGHLSIYFGGDPVFHFDVEGRLRRAYWRGLLYRTQGATLAQLTRRRTESTTELVRHDLSPVELQQFLNLAADKLTTFRNDLTDGRAKVIRQVPDDDTTFHADLVARVDQILTAGTPLAATIPGKR